MGCYPTYLYKEDYIITLNNPKTVKDIYHALKQIDEATFKENGK